MSFGAARVIGVKSSSIGGKARCQIRVGKESDCVCQYSVDNL